MMGFLTKLAGWRGYAALAVVSGALAWQVQSWRYEAQIARIKATQAQGRANAAGAALDQLQGDINTIAAAARRAAAVGPSLTDQINKITGALKNAPPLPDGCRPDSVRVRSLTDAVRATNSAAAGPQPGATMPADP